MKIAKVLTRHRNDYTADMVCEHCDAKAVDNCGYMDANYLENVIPAMHCPQCGKNRDGEVRAAVTTLSSTEQPEREVFEILEETADYVTLRPPRTFNGQIVTGRNVASQCQHVRDVLGLEVIAINPLARFMVCKRLPK